MMTLLEALEELKKRRYDLKFKCKGYLEISKQDRIILRCSFYVEKGKDITEVPGTIDTPKGETIRFRKMEDIYLLEEGLGIVFVDKWGKKKMLKESKKEHKWILEDFLVEKEK